MSIGNIEKLVVFLGSLQFFALRAAKRAFLRVTLINLFMQRSFKHANQRYPINLLISFRKYRIKVAPIAPYMANSRLNKSVLP
jgi:hypothetical protein